MPGAVQFTSVFVFKICTTDLPVGAATRHLLHHAHIRKEAFSWSQAFSLPSPLVAERERRVPSLDSSSNPATTCRTLCLAQSPKLIAEGFSPFNKLHLPTLGNKNSPEFSGFTEVKRTQAQTVQHSGS